MPVEIKELVIRTVVSDSRDSTDESDSPRYSEAVGAASGVNAEAMVQECVRQVMRILARNKER